MVDFSDRLTHLPPYLFTRINQLKQDAYAKKLDVIDLGMGNPDQPPPGLVIDRLCDTVNHHPSTHRYPQAKGMPKLRKSIASWMERRFDVRLDPEREVVTLIGSKEGIAHLAMAVLNPGDTVLVGEPSYPAHFNGVILAGGEVHSIPLRPENNYLPELEKIPEVVARRSKLLFLNYPNNPTAAVVPDKAVFKDWVAFAKKYDVIVCHDNPYCEITFDGYRAPSFLEVEGAKDVGIESHSFSKTYNMAGWRMGWMCGSARVIAAVEKFKSFLDYGVATFLQLSGVAALDAWPASLGTTVSVYQRRRDQMADGLTKMGWNVPRPKGTMYLWAPLPDGFKEMGSLAFAENLLRETGIVVAPGIGFGASGEGYVRMALVTHDNRFHDALLRFRKVIAAAKPKTNGKVSRDSTRPSAASEGQARP
ncbi:MAG TPA: aminotransferase class I/II-fold pyridoxal phosphate-dependent enzyme [Elusimicrobiota bacterium]|nr:aminotransferase class I/II-fold pyridoxal phosphate-dependent enzyme [Elusimicrobiota bacterium]